MSPKAVLLAACLVLGFAGAAAAHPHLARHGAVRCGRPFGGADRLVPVAALGEQIRHGRLRQLLRLPKPLQITAVSLLRFPAVARAAVQQTRVRKAS